MAKVIQEGRLQQLLEKCPQSQDRIGNFCKFYCPECNKELRSIHTFHAHLRTKHKTISMTETMILMMDSSKVMVHVCKICHKVITCDASLLSRHFTQTHGETLGEYCINNNVQHEGAKMKSCSKWQEILNTSKRTDSFDNLCRFSCHLCKREFYSWRLARDHLRTHTNNDGMQVRGSVLSHVTKSVLFKCKLCQVLCDKMLITRHINANHKINIPDYFERIGGIYVKKNDADNSLQEALSKYLRSQNVGNMCRFQCMICENPFSSWKYLQIHLRKKHEKACKIDEVLTHGSNKIVAHSCVLCSKLLLNDMYWIHSHVQGSHKMRSLEYCKLTKSKQIDRYNSINRISPESISAAPNLCKFKCFVCQESKRSWKAMFAHARMYHKSLIGSIRYQDFLTKTVMHKCLLCSRNVLSDRMFILQHCVANHGISTLKNYGSSTTGQSTNEKSTKKASKQEAKSLNDTVDLLKDSRRKRVKPDLQSTASHHDHGLKDCSVVLLDIMESSDSENDSDMCDYD